MASSNPVPNDGTFEMADNKVAQFEAGEKPPSEGELANDPEFEGTKSAPEDRLAMQRMGKKQQLIVRVGLAKGIYNCSY
jgi:hypothetical protein